MKSVGHSENAKVIEPMEIMKSTMKNVAKKQGRMNSYARIHMETDGMAVTLKSKDHNIVKILKMAKKKLKKLQ